MYFISGYERQGSRNGMVSWAFAIPPKIKLNKISTNFFITNTLF